jgi:hypothetical protein
MIKLAAFGSMLLVAAACSSGGTGNSSTTGTTGSSSGTTTIGTTSGTSTSSSSGTSSSGSGSSTGGGAGSTTTTGTSTTGAFVQAEHPPLPQIQFLTGPVLASAQVYPVFFSDADPQQDTNVRSYLSWLFGSNAFDATLLQYGVGTPTLGATVSLTDASPGTIDNPGIQSYLASKLNANDPSWPTPDSNTLIVLFFPMGNTVHHGSEVSCADFNGFNSQVQLDSTHGDRQVAYAVIVNCAPGGLVLGGTDGVQFALSAQVANATSDPQPDVVPGYARFTAGPWADATPVHHEIADVCQGNYLRDATSGNLQARLWSNSVSALTPSIDPCVPTADGGIYINAAPPQSTEYTVSISGQDQTVTVNLLGFSEAPVSDWNITAVPLSVAGEFASSPMLAASHINNKNHVQLTLTVPANTGPGALGGAWILNQTDEELDAGIVASSWPIVVKVQ